MSFLLGMRGVTTIRNSGAFFCPSCETEKPFCHKNVRNFFTLFFIPIIPLNSVGEYVECKICSSTFHTTVLDLSLSKNTECIEAEFHRGIKQVMVQMLLADGVIDDREIETIRKIYTFLTGKDLAVKSINAEIKHAQGNALGIEATMKKMSGVLNNEGKEMVFRAAFMVAAADEKIHSAENNMLKRIGNYLDMTPTHINAVKTDIMGDGKDN